MKAPKPLIKVTSSPAAVVASASKVAVNADAPVDPRAGLLASQQALLKIEQDARSVEKPEHLWFLLANDGRRLVQARQISVLDHRFKTLAVSSLAKVDRQSATIRWLERAAREITATSDTGAVRTASIETLKVARDETARHFPFPHLALVSCKSREGAAIGHVLMAREVPFSEQDMATAQRLAASFGHAAQALGVGKRGLQWPWRRVLFASGLALLSVLLVVVKVPMLALAPAEVVARQPMVVTAPMDGVIDDIKVDVGAAVQPGDVLLRFVDTQARNQLAIAEQDLAVAEARWRQVSLASFSDATARRELRPAESEMALKRAERDYARDLLQRSEIRADRAGVAIYADRRELLGRPVQTGQRLMEIADPNKLRIRVQVAVEDALAIRTGSEGKVFLDADPLHPLVITVAETAHQARLLENNALAFRVDADVAAADLPRLRVGHRGTAQLAGDEVSLGLYLFRRPITWLRQKVGI